MFEELRHDIAGEYGSKDADDEDTYAIVVIVEKGVAVLPLEQ